MFSLCIINDTLHKAGAPSGLPSFSTPGFRQPKPPSIQTSTSELIVVSDSDPSTPSALKRTSSDPDVLSGPSPQAYKRPKKTRLAAEKENLMPTDPYTNSKENKSAFISRLVNNASTPPGPSRTTNQDSSRPSWMEAHLDLMEVSPDPSFELVI
jgi:hypothetical protein